MKLFPWHKNKWLEVVGNRQKLSHALILYGQAGIGKGRFAEALARSLLCESPLDNGEPCGTCLACGWMNTATHPDFQRIIPEIDEVDTQNAESGTEEKEKKQKGITIQQIRQLLDSVSLSAGRGGMRVVIIQPAEAMNVNAANALLKTLEEPPPQVLFMLVSHQLQRLPATVRSRCTKVAMPRPTIEQSIAWLRETGIEAPEFQLAQAGFAPLLAAELNTIEYRDKRTDFLNKLADTPRHDPLATAEKLEKEKVELSVLLNWLHTWLYDLLLTRYTGTARYHLDFADKIQRLSTEIDVHRLLEYQRDLLSAQRVVNHPLNLRLVIEQLLMSYWQTMKRTPTHG